MSEQQNRDTLRITAPLDRQTLAALRIGQRVLLSGSILAGRDTVHLLLVQLLHDKRPLPLDLADQIIYYVGPAPARPGRASGAAGPTTSSRMDPYTPPLLDRGLKGMIGKGPRGPLVREAMIKHGAVYFAAIGGAGALAAQCIVDSEIVAWPKLGPEALRRLQVRELPLIVANDAHGGDLFEQGRDEYARGEDGSAD